MKDLLALPHEIGPLVQGTGVQAPFDYWQELRGAADLPPAYEDFDPMRIPRNLASVLLVECLPDGGFLYRLGGARLVERYRVDSVAGKTPEELFGKKAKLVVRPYGKVRDTGMLFFRDAPRDWIRRDPTFVAYKVLLLPFRDGEGTVARILAAFDFDRV